MQKGLAVPEAVSKTDGTPFEVEKLRHALEQRGRRLVFVGANNGAPLNSTQLAFFRIAFLDDWSVSLRRTAKGPVLDSSTVAEMVEEGPSRRVRQGRVWKPSGGAPPVGSRERSPAGCLTPLATSGMLGSGQRWGDGGLVGWVGWNGRGCLTRRRFAHRQALARDCWATHRRARKPPYAGAWE
jgi:hypothetical protein